MSAERSLADARHRHGAVASEDLATAEECGHHETATGLHIATTPTEPPAHVDVALRRVQAACESLAAPLDALLADIKAIMHDAPAFPKTTSPKPPAMLSPSPCPTSSYLGAVLNGGGHTLSAPPSPKASAPPSPTVIKGQPLRVHQRAQPCRRTGQRNSPRAPSPPNEVPPFHPYSMQGGLPTPTMAMLVQATSLCCSAV
jgi:hypothetical protein